MKLALNDAQLPIEANAEAPQMARCLHCGGVVLLRHRRRNHPRDDVVYFWRHRDHENAGCPARFTVGIRKAKGAEYMDNSLRSGTKA